MKKQQSELDVLENYINDIPLILDPCRLCENKMNIKQFVVSACIIMAATSKLRGLWEKK